MYFISKILSSSLTLSLLLVILLIVFFREFFMSKKRKNLMVYLSVLLLFVGIKSLSTEFLNDNAVYDLKKLLNIIILLGCYPFFERFFSAHNAIRALLFFETVLIFLYFPLDYFFINDSVSNWKVSIQYALAFLFYANIFMWEKGIYKKINFLLVIILSLFFIFSLAKWLILNLAVLVFIYGKEKKFILIGLIIVLIGSNYLDKLMKIKNYDNVENYLDERIIRSESSTKQYYGVSDGGRTDLLALYIDDIINNPKLFGQDIGYYNFIDVHEHNSIIFY